MDWNTVIGKPLLELLKNEQTYTEAGKIAGQAYFNAFLAKINSQNIASILSGGSQGGAGGASSSGSDTNQGDPGKDKGFFQSLFDKSIKLVEEAGGDLVKDYLKDGVKSLIGKATGKTDEKGKCVCICKCNCGRGRSGGGLMGDGYGSGSERDGKKKRNRRNRRGTRSFGGQLDTNNEDPSKSSNRNKAERKIRSTDASNSAGAGRGRSSRMGRASFRSGSALGLKGKSGLRSLLGMGAGVLMNNAPELLEKGKEQLGKGSSWLKENGSKVLKKSGKWLGRGAKWLGKAGKLLPGPAGLLMDVGNIAAADSKRDKTRAAGSAALSIAGGAIGGAIGSIIPGAGTVIGATLGSIAGDFIGDKLGGFFYDKFSKKSKKNKGKGIPPSTGGLSMVGASVAGLSSSTFSRKAEGYQEFQPSNLNLSQSYGQATNIAPQQINVSVDKDAINLTVNKDEINYEFLAELAGQKIASQVRFAMQNVR
ncbi:hypothetical protein D3C73_891330 [compost metagenome]